MDLDLHFVNERERLCHGSESDLGCSPFDRMYAYAILEIGNWLNSASGRKQVVTLSFEEPETGQDAHVEDPLVAYFGSKLALPEDFPQFTTLKRAPTSRELLDSGRQVVVTTRWDTHGGDLLFGSVALGGDTGILFYEDADGNDHPNVQFEPANSICKTGLSNGTGFNLLNLFDKFSLIAENRLFVFTTWDITAADVSQAARCLVSMLTLDEFGGGPNAQNSPTDLRHENAIWSWLPGDMGSNGDGVVMLQNSSNRWASRNPLEVHQFLCGRHRSESPGDPNDWPHKKGQDFKVTAGAGTWFQGGQKCLEEFGENYVFSVPVSGYQNVRAALASNVISTWMNYNDIKQENTWVINKRPVAEAGQPQTLECTSTSGAVATLNGTLSTDPENDSLTYVWTGPLGSATGDIVQITVPLGTHTVRLVTDDGFSGVDPDEVTVTVQDTTGPVIESLTPVPPTSWPPDHKTVPVSVTVKATDACDTNVRSRIVSVTSNEAVGARGAGTPTGPDWQITGPLTVNLNASGTGSGRIYTLTIESADSGGNKTQETTNVWIPHNVGNGNTTSPPGRSGGTGQR